MPRIRDELVLDAWLSGHSLRAIAARPDVALSTVAVDGTVPADAIGIARGAGSPTGI